MVFRNPDIMIGNQEEDELGLGLASTNPTKMTQTSVANGDADRRSGQQSDVGSEVHAVPIDLAVMTVRHLGVKTLTVRRLLHTALFVRAVRTSFISGHHERCMQLIGT